MRLTETMRFMLGMAVEAPSRGWDAVTAMTPGQGSALRALERRGLVRCVGLVEGESFDQAVLGYEATDDGRSAELVEAAP